MNRAKIYASIHALVVLAGLALASPVLCRAADMTPHQRAARNNSRQSSKFMKQQKKEQRKAQKSQRKAMRQRSRH